MWNGNNLPPWGGGMFLFIRGLKILWKTSNDGVSIMFLVSSHEEHSKNYKNQLIFVSQVMEYCFRISTLSNPEWPLKNQCKANGILKNTLIQKTGREQIKADRII